MRKHPLYTEATGTGPQGALVRIVPPQYVRRPDAHRDQFPVLAVLRGATWDRGDSSSAWALWRLRVKHPTATDFEHDRSTVADLDVANPVVLSTLGPGITWIGTLIEVRLYPLGTDPTQVPDRDTRPGMCTDPACGEPHPFAPYLPPVRAEIEALLPAIVAVEILPLEHLERGPS